MKMLYRSLVAASMILLSASSYAAVTVVASQDFESPTLPNSNGWTFGAQSGGAVSISTDTSLNHAGSKGSIKANYPIAKGAMYVWGSVDLTPLKLNDIYIEFWAKMPGAKQGLKFLKIFGVKGTSDYANTTFALTSDAGIQGSMTQISFGDGSSLTNDTQNVVNLDGTYLDWIGRALSGASILTPQKKRWAGTNWGTDWHHFRVHVKFNSGTTAANQVADGAYYLEIDDVVYANATKLFNRHYSNGPIQSVSIFDWAQNGTAAFELWYDDFKITTGGFDDRKPEPPSKPQLIIK